MDILLSADGDLYLTETGDISLVESVAQKIKINSIGIGCGTVLG